ncbi:hypothetical protein HUJ05_007761 [Dendroctonus ponderosae]|nr:hypothetical protein HUJ05_007761 [Dendroctonus ponderosae]
MQTKEKYLTSKNFYQENAFFFEIIYVINMFIMCYCGQRLEYKMKTVGDFLYSTHWYNLNPKLQSLIPLVILNSQKTIRMDAVPIGYLNYELFVTVRIRKSGDECHVELNLELKSHDFLIFLCDVSLAPAANIFKNEGACSPVYPKM